MKGKIGKWGMKRQTGICWNLASSGSSSSQTLKFKCYALVFLRNCWVVLVFVWLCLFFFSSRTLFVSCGFLSLICNSWLNILKNREGFALVLLAWLCSGRSSWTRETFSTIETILIFHCANIRQKANPSEFSSCVQAA